MSKPVLISLLALSIASASVVLGQSDAPPDAGLIQGFLPKEDLGVLDFLARHPEADGDGIVVAILDTGVDLGHPALRTTPGGARKILDVFDGTDDGHLPLPLSVPAGEGSVRGLSGRTLSLPSGIPADDTIRIGLFLGRRGFPQDLQRRRGSERREEWRRRREAWEGEHHEDRSPRARAVREAFDAVLEEGADPGDRFDVVAARTEGGWRAWIDVDGDGDLAEETALAPYGESAAVARFPDPVHLSVACERIAPDGSSLHLFFDEGGHGTHVAGIVGGWYGPGDPLNGLAPGVQLLAAKVGNGRFGGSTSHNSIVKSAQWAVEHGADVINLSFGGDTFFDDGREQTSSFLDELVEKTGVIVCASAGNAGPALSTVGSPGSARRIFGWGAAISKKTQETNYGTLDPRREDLFHFSSRGPLLDGDPGVDFISPGAALSPLPTWLLLKGESWNGTSMASPQGAGFCALMLSAARAMEIPVDPARLRRAMRAGARRLPGVPVIEQGDGIPQALPTLAALERLATAYPPDGDRRVVDWRITVHNATGRGGGYYERDLRRAKPYRVGFHVRPDLPEDTLQSARADFLRIVGLSSEVPWMRAPGEQSIHSAGETIEVEIDPARLERGRNVGRVVARDVSRPEAGVEFALVATVIRPESVDPLRPVLEATWDLESGDRRSLFVRVPEGATRALLRLTERSAEPANAYQVSLSQPDLVRDPGQRVRDRRIDLAREETGALDLPVRPGGVLEAAVFSRWVDNRSGRLDLRLTFDGIQIAGEPPLAIERGLPGVGFVAGAPAWGGRFRFEAALDAREEPVEVAWTVRSDSLFPEPLLGIPAMVQEGEAYVSGRKGKRVELALRIGPEFEDLLDDSFYRVYDAAGGEVAAGYLYRPRIGFEAPETGTFRIRFWIWTRGSRIFDETTVISPVLLRPSGPHELDIYRDPVGGYRGDGENASRTSMVGGETRRFFLRADDLPDEAVLHGQLRVIGEEDPPLAEVALRADTHPLVPPPTDEWLSTAVDDVLRRARLLAGWRRPDVERREAILDALALCERLRVAAPQPEDEPEDDRREEEEEDELPPDELWDLREARVAVLRAHPSLERYERAIGVLRESLPAADPTDPRTVADRREKEAVVLARTAELQLRKGDAETARRRLNEARSLDPSVPGADRLETLLLAWEGEADEARKKARDWLEDHPSDAEIDRIRIEALLELGWTDLAALAASDRVRRYPEAVEEARLLWERISAAPAPGSPLLPLP